MEDVLYRWAFAKPRKKGEDSENVFYEAEIIRQWNTMKNHDTKYRTNFASQLDVEKPEEAPQGGFRQLELQYLAHKANQSPIETIAALKKLEWENLQDQSSHLREMLDQMVDRGQELMAAIDAVDQTRAEKSEAEMDDGKPAAAKRR